MTLKFTAQDIALLNDFRLDRLYQLYAHLLGGCMLELKFESLILHCSEPWCVDQLMQNLDELVKAAWTILGVKCVSICFASEEVYRARTRSRRCLSRTR